MNINTFEMYLNTNRNALHFCQKYSNTDMNKQESVLKFL